MTIEKSRAIKIWKKALPLVKALIKMEYKTQYLIELAFAAHRTNNGYVKQTRRYSEGQPTTFANKELVALTAHGEWRPEDFVPLEITDADREAKRAADKHMRRYTLLAMGDLPDFEADLFAAYSSEKMPIGRVGLIAYLPAFVERELQKKIYKQRMKTEFSDSAYITENITEGTEVEILKVIPLTNYDFGKPDFGEPAYLHFGAIGKDLVCFSKKEMYAVGETYEMVGRIKGQDKERDSGLPMTRMNYVKLRKQEV